jgi:hypothetical protein
MTFEELLAQRCVRQGELCLASLQCISARCPLGISIRLRSMAGAPTGRRDPQASDNERRSD